MLQGLSHRAERFRARECGSGRVRAILMGFFAPPPCSRKSADLVAPRRSAAVPQPCGTFPSRERSAGNSAGKRGLTAQPSPLSEFRDPQHELIHAVASGSFPHLGNLKYPKRAEFFRWKIRINGHDPHTAPIQRPEAGGSCGCTGLALQGCAGPAPCRWDLRALDPLFLLGRGDAGSS